MTVPPPRPLDHLDPDDASGLYDACAAVLADGVFVTVKLLLDTHADAAAHRLPDGRMALHQVIGPSPP